MARRKDDLLSVSIRAPEVVATIHTDNRFAQAAMEWNYRLRNRRRWADNEDTRREQAQRMRSFMTSLGLDDETLRTLAAAGTVEVSAAFQREEEGWAGRVFPWEYALSAATKELRDEMHAGPLTVVRHLAASGGAAPADDPFDTVVFIAAAPGPLADAVRLDAEEHLVQASLEPRRRFEVLESPTLSEIAAAIEEVRPQLVHVAGVDLHQGRSILGLPAPAARLDGMFLSGEQGELAEVSYAELAEALAGGGARPRLVGLNLQNSAARIAAMTVARGAEATIGFQHEMDGRLAELFFSELYSGLRDGAGAERGALLEAFHGAREALSRKPHGLRATGVVLWGRRHWLAPGLPLPRRRAPRPAPAEGDRAGTGTPGVLPRGSGRTDRDDETTLLLERGGGAAGPPPRITIDVVPAPRLNYAMLHNQRPIFELFRIVKPIDRPAIAEVEVTLHAGADSFPFRAVRELGAGAVHDLTQEVFLPLVSSLWRSMRESMLTALTVRVAIDGCMRYLRTHPVTLLPPDEWVDSDEERIWLPSFVLPHDGTVPAIVAAAQRYLMALEDDREAGFDGYQRVDLDQGEPAAPDPVELQARALWHAIQHDHPLKYISPPPTFTLHSQRVRTPTQVVCGGRGTCIDVALLFAACLEYVEIHPVLFLVQGHAFPGWWRTEKAFQAFAEMSLAPPAPHPTAAASSGQRCPWFMERSQHDEIMHLVEAGDLVPIETMALTEGGRFRDAVASARGRLRDDEAFHAMADVALARRHRVTPLPLVEAERRRPH